MRSARGRGPEARAGERGRRRARTRAPPRDSLVPAAGLAFSCFVLRVGVHLAGAYIHKPKTTRAIPSSAAGAVYHHATRRCAQRVVRR